MLSTNSTMYCTEIFPLLFEKITLHKTNNNSKFLTNPCHLPQFLFYYFFIVQTKNLDLIQHKAFTKCRKKNQVKKLRSCRDYRLLVFFFVFIKKMHLCTLKIFFYIIILLFLTIYLLRRLQIASMYITIIIIII